MGIFVCYFYEFVEVVEIAKNLQKIQRRA